MTRTNCEQLKGSTVLRAGLCEVSLDENRRFPIPSAVFRQIGLLKDDSVWLAKNPDATSLVMIPASSFEVWRAKYISDDYDKRVILGSAVERCWDKKHRILIPAHLAQYARLIVPSPIILISMDYHFEVWAAEDYRKLRATT